ncbi:MAG: XrtA system polysaccharide deacetylase [Myxococcota bacterium]
MSSPINAFSIDVEDWFHILELEGAPSLGDWSKLESRVERNLDRLLEIAEAASVRATCFFLGWVVEHHPETAKRALAGGHEIATHGYGHDLVTEIGPSAFRTDLEREIETVERATGVRPVGYRAPGFSISENALWAFEILAELGIEFDSSIFPVKRAHGGLAGANPLPHSIDLPGGRSLAEFPISVTSVLGQRVAYCGGGYLRLFPYWFIRSRIAAANARGEPVVIYIHPRDIDPDQPRIEMPASRRFKSYINLGGTGDKLSRLLTEFPFGTVSEALGNA